MSVIWSGITESGAVVPVQVTDEGKVVATTVIPTDLWARDGTTLKPVNEGDDVEVTGQMLVGTNSIATDNPQVKLGSFERRGTYFSYGPTSTSSIASAFQAVIADNSAGSNERVTASIRQNGAAEFANSACGFTPGGELIFTSGGEKYKMVVTNGVCNAEPYTRLMRSEDFPS